MIQIKDYKIFDVTDNIRIALKNNMIEQYNINAIGKDFVKTMDKLANNIANLPINFKHSGHPESPLERAGWGGSPGFARRAGVRGGGGRSRSGGWSGAGRGAFAGAGLPPAARGLFLPA